MYLNPLRKLVQQLEEMDFAECKPVLIPLMHVVCTLWGNSRYYNHSSKITILLRQLCNLLIQQVSFLKIIDITRYIIIFCINFERLNVI